MGTDAADLDAQLEQAQGFVRQRKYQQAIDLCQKILEADDRLVAAHQCIAAAGFMSKDYELAVEHFKRVSVLEPRDAACLVNLGAVYNRMEEYNKAMGALRQAIQRDRNSSEGYYNLGLAYKGMNQLAMAVSAYRDAVKLNPDMVEGMVNLANVYFEMKNYQQAIIHYRKALEINPDSKRAKAGLAQAENISNEQKNISNPFGRLVDAETAAAARKSNTVEQRKMKEVERLKDRSDMVNLSSAIESSASRLFTKLEGDLGIGLNELDHCLAEGVAAPTAFSKEIDKFQATLKNCHELRKQLKANLKQLEEHEESVAAMLNKS